MNHAKLKLQNTKITHGPPPSLSLHLPSPFPLPLLFKALYSHLPTWGSILPSSPTAASLHTHRGDSPSPASQLHKNEASIIYSWHKMEPTWQMIDTLRIITLPYLYLVQTQNAIHVDERHLSVKKEGTSNPQHLLTPLPPGATQVSFPQGKLGSLGMRLSTYK